MAKNLNGFFTDKGNVSVKVRNAIKTDMLKEMKDKLALHYPNVVIGSDGAFYIEIGIVDGKFVYSRLELTISTKNPND